MSSWSSTAALGPVRRCAILLRGRLICAWCLQDPTPEDKPRGRSLQIDHVVQRADGGLSSPANLVPACWDCNQARADGFIEARLLSLGVSWRSAKRRVARQLQQPLDVKEASFLARQWYPWLGAYRERTRLACRRWRERRREVAMEADTAHSNMVIEGDPTIDFPFGFNIPQEGDS